MFESLLQFVWICNLFFISFGRSITAGMRSSSWRQMASTASCRIRRSATWSTEPRIRLRQHVPSLTRPCNIHRKTTPQPSSCRSARGATTRPVLPSFTASDVRWRSAAVSVSLAARIPSVLYVTLLPSSRGNISSSPVVTRFVPSVSTLPAFSHPHRKSQSRREFKVREDFFFQVLDKWEKLKTG